MKKSRELSEYSKGEDKGRNDSQSTQSGIDLSTAGQESISAYSSYANLHKDNSHSVKTPKVVADEVLNFIKERHFRSYFPQQ